MVIDNFDSGKGYGYNYTEPEFIFYTEVNNVLAAGSLLAAGCWLI